MKKKQPPIKFRSIDLRAKRPIMSYSETNRTICEITIPLFLRGSLTPQIKVMQFTGAYDKNKKEIYDKDYYQRYNYLYEVFWDNISFSFRGKCIARIDDADPKRMKWKKESGLDSGGNIKKFNLNFFDKKITEVIGNVYEYRFVKRELIYKPKYEPE